MNVKKGIHHIRHSRPQWYHDYHQWEHHSTLHWITFVVSSLVILMGFYNIAVQTVQQPVAKPASAAEGYTNLTQAVNAGNLTLTSDPYATLSATTASQSNADTTGSLGEVRVTDNRGTGVGWSVTASIYNNFIKVNNPARVSGTAGSLTLDASSTYYGSNTAGTYTITVNTPGVLGVATLNVSGLESATDVATTGGSNLVIGTRGVVVDMGADTYSAGDSWTIRVDIIPVATALDVNPGVLTTNSGDNTNVSAGGADTFSAVGDQVTLMSVSTAGYGMGSYSVTPALTLTVPGNSYVNSYTTTVIETAT